MTLPETENYTLKELVRNNCRCAGEAFCDCDSCKIDQQVALAVKEWLLQKQQNNPKWNPQTNDFINELLKDLQK